MSDVSAPGPHRFTYFRKNMEIMIAILLGLVSIATAYCSFQSSLYGGSQTQNYTNGTNLSTEAESQYLEGNQKYVQDAQLFDRLTDLRLDIANPDPAISAAAKIKYDTVSFQSVSEDFAKAITWADQKNAADPKTYTSPLNNEAYQTSLFGGYADTKEKALKRIADGDKDKAFGEMLTLATVIMAISLFLLGIGAVVSAFRIKVLLGSVAVVIFLLAAVLAATIPALPLFS